MRITGGSFRSRILTAPRGDETRPTSDRVREALFSILASAVSLSGARALDLYAGTGALGLEALSRGASHVTFVERRREALHALRENVRALGVESQSLVVGRTLDAAASALAGPFDLIFADPPYADVQSGTATAAVARVLETVALAEAACLVFEHSSKTQTPVVGPFPPAFDSRIYGDTALSFYRVGQG